VTSVHPILPHFLPAMFYLNEMLLWFCYCKTPPALNTTTTDLTTATTPNATVSNTILSSATVSNTAVSSAAVSNGTTS
jgi:hypothetical protein